MDKPPRGTRPATSLIVVWSPEHRRRSFLQLYFSFRLAKTMNSVSHFFSVFHSSYAFKKLEPFYPGTHFHALIRSCSPTEFVIIISLYWDHVVAGRVPTIMVFFIINLHHLWMIHVVRHVLPLSSLPFSHRSTDAHLLFSFFFSPSTREDDEQCLFSTIPFWSSPIMLIDHSRNIETIGI